MDFSVAQNVVLSRFVILLELNKIVLPSRGVRQQCRMQKRNSGLCGSSPGMKLAGETTPRPGYSVIVMVY